MGDQYRVDVVEKTTTEFNEEGEWTIYTPRAYFFDSLEEAQAMAQTVYLPTGEKLVIPAGYAPSSTLDRIPIKLTVIPRCDCGGKKTGSLDYGAGHSDWCKVHESKKP